MEFAVILCVIFAFVLFKLVLEQRAAARRDNLRVLEEALKNPAIDRATLENLTYQLTGRQSARSHERTPWFGRLQPWILALGWGCLFCGVAVWVVGEMVGKEDLLISGVGTGILGFGLITYPFALRELEARRQQS
jgi:hypothetical protein